jgi:hypothetical protein
MVCCARHIADRPDSSTAMAAPAPNDSPARNTRLQARIEQRKQQLRATYPYQHKVPFPFPDYTKEQQREQLERWEGTYEAALHEAATNPESTWLLMELARASIRDGAMDNVEKYLRKHYLPHLHCMMHACKACDKEAPCDWPSEFKDELDDEYYSESEWEQRWKAGERDIQRFY